MEFWSEENKPLSQMREIIQHEQGHSVATIEREAGTLDYMNIYLAMSDPCGWMVCYQTATSCKMLKENVYCVVNRVFSIFGAYIDRPTEFQNDSDMTGVNYKYSNIVFKVVSRNYGRGSSVAELEQVCK